jgi:geranylgeranyl diphosphate synthase type II
MRYSVFSGGKRIRPILAIESSKACAGNLKDAIPIACAIEMLHTYSLIHDDLPAMDDDDYRRGKPTCHRIFGEANAILAGDALFALAFNIISKKIDSGISVGVIRELSDAIGTKGMVGGQVLDLEFQDKRKTKETLSAINRMKTSRLFEASTKAGAIASGTSAKEVKAMAKFGRSFGLAFQIIDDILDRGDYVKTFGMEKARRDSKNLVKKAKSFLRIFGKKAQNLKSIADYTLERRI